MWIFSTKTLIPLCNKNHLSQHLVILSFEVNSRQFPRNIFISLLRHIFLRFTWFWVLKVNCSFKSTAAPWIVNEWLRWKNVYFCGFCTFSKQIVFVAFLHKTTTNFLNLWLKHSTPFVIASYFSLWIYFSSQTALFLVIFIKFSLIFFFSLNQGSGNICDKYDNIRKFIATIIFTDYL